MCKHYRVKGRVVKAVDKLDLDIPDSSIVSVVGKSGCGKTTLLRALSGLEKPDAGRIMFMGEKKPRQAARPYRHGVSRAQAAALAQRGAEPGPGPAPC
jgi:ABC-type sugar transport system ATPase subunit